eukprot:9161761-Karenia_brevis.AAC.1
MAVQEALDSYQFEEVENVETIENGLGNIMDATCSGLSSNVDRAQQWSPHDLRLELASAMQ